VTRGFSSLLVLHNDRRINMSKECGTLDKLGSLRSRSRQNPKLILRNPQN
jgi:hypothetical protein